MRCFVRINDGKNIPFTFSRQDKVIKVRKTIALKVESEPSKLRIFYLGKQLEDSRTLYDYSVKDNTTLICFLKGDISAHENSYKNSPSSDSKYVIPTPTNSDAKEDKKKAIEVNEDLKALQEEEEECSKCDNKPETECKDCGCNECGKKSNEELILICDECQYYFHTFCLPAPLESIPDGEWYCHHCFNDPTKIVAAGEASKIIVKKEIKRKWDSGMACVGLTKKCTIVKSDHIGPIPGVPVGSTYRFRIHLSESGVHRPHVAGIHGSSKTVAYSIVLAGGYIDDKDFGNYFYYTGAGGRDLSGNKRTAEQSFDQKLHRTNRALANTLKQKINETEGDTAKDWRKSSPVRVSRSYKLLKHFPKYAPKEGVRYDGIYKLVRYWPEKGEDGFIVWRYEFRRDDLEPSPWTPEGIKRIKDLGLVMYNPDADATEPDSKKSKCKKKGRGKKKEEDSDISSEDFLDEKPIKKAKITQEKKDFPKTIYKLKPETLALIAEDLLNTRTWQLLINSKFNSETEFLEEILSKEFMCPICHDPVEEPVSTSCGHNACRLCLKSSLINFGPLCPLCRCDLYPELKKLGKKELEVEIKSIASQLTVNSKLVNILSNLIPTYGK